MSARSLPHPPIITLDRFRFTFVLVAFLVACIANGCVPITMSRTDSQPKKVKVKRLFKGPSNFLPGGVTKGKDGIIYVRGDDLYAFTPDGKLKWTHKIGTFSVSDPVIGRDGLIYTSSNGVLGVNPEGERKVFFVPEESSSKFAVAKDGTVYTVGLDGSRLNVLFAYRPDGTERWRFKAKKPSFNAPTIGKNGEIYLSVENGLQVLTPEGSLKWEFLVESGAVLSFQTPAIGADGTTYLAGNYKLYAFDSSGHKKWETAEDGYSGVRIGKNGTLYAASGEGFVALAPDGKKVWVFKVDGSINAPALGDDGTIYFASEYSGEGALLGQPDNRLFAISPDGKEKWNIRTDKYGFVLPGTDSDSIYLFDNKGRLCMAAPGEG